MVVITSGQLLEMWIQLNNTGELMLDYVVGKKQNFYVLQTRIEFGDNLCDILREMEFGDNCVTFYVRLNF
jgi:hypothetical protein